MAIRVYSDLMIARLIAASFLHCIGTTLRGDMAA